MEPLSLAYDDDPGGGLEEAADHRAQIRLWLRLLASTTLIAGELRRRFREDFDTTIPRFEILAQLDRQPGGLVLGELSKRLMVSPANLTPIIERLIKDDFVTRTPSSLDRRIQIVCLTASGQRRFRRMAKRHGAWLAEMLKDYPASDIDRLNVMLDQLKTAVRAGQASSVPAVEGERLQSRRKRSASLVR